MARWWILSSLLAALVLLGAVLSHSIAPQRRLRWKLVSTRELHTSEAIEADDLSFVLTYDKTPPFAPPLLERDVIGRRPFETISRGSWIELAALESVQPFASESGRIMASVRLAGTGTAHLALRRPLILLGTTAEAGNPVRLGPVELCSYQADEEGTVWLLVAVKEGLLEELARLLACGEVHAVRVAEANDTTNDVQDP